MTEDRNRVDFGRMAAGLIVLAAGLALLADRLGWLHVHDLGRLWPLILIGIGAASAATAGSTRRRRGGLLLAFTGGWLLIASLGLFGLDFGTAWPLALVAIGLARVLAPSPPHRAASGGWFLIGLGAFFLAWTLRLWDFELDNAWPLLLIAAGIFIIFRAFEARDTDDRRTGVNDEHCC